MKADSQQTDSPFVRPSPAPSIYRDPGFIKGMEDACYLARETLELIEERIRPGVTTNEIDKLVYEFTVKNGAIPAPLNFRGFPKSCCTSVNEVVCHGIPDDRVLEEGDIVNVDVTPKLHGYHGDTNKTFFVGECSEEAKKITAVSRECLNRALAITRPHIRVGDIGATIQEYAHAQGCSVVEEFVGHGIGTGFHESPMIPHFGKRGTGVLIVPGMFFTIEPMINLGEKGVEVLEDGWTAVTMDRKLSAQFEHTVFITEDGIRVLTREERGQVLA